MLSLTNHVKHPTLEGALIKFTRNLADSESSGNLEDSLTLPLVVLPVNNCKGKESFQ